MPAPRSNRGVAMHTLVAHYRALFLAPQWFVPVALALMLSGQACALPTVQRPGYAAHHTLMPQVGVVTIQNQAGYQSYHASTLNDVRGYSYLRQARGEACQRGIGLPYSTVRNFFRGGRTDNWFTADVRWGEGTLHKAMSQATASMHGDEALVDITIDQQKVNVLGILYREICLVVQGRIVGPPLLDVNKAQDEARGDEASP